MSEIISSSTLLEFKGNRRVFSGAFVSKTGESFKSLIFVDPTDETKKTFVHFSSKLGELTPKQIGEMKNDLQVVTMDSGSHILCKKGDGGWESVDI